MIKTIQNMDSKKIAEYLKGLPTTDRIAVLARNHSLLIRLSEELDFMKLPYVYIGRESALTHSEEFVKLHAFLKLTCNPYDSLAFLLIKDIIRISASEYTAIRARAAVMGTSHFQEWMRVLDLADNIYQAFFFYKRETFADDINWMNGFTWPFDARPITEFIDKYINENPKATVQSYLDWLATIDIQDEVKEDYEGLTLMTIHAAKGLEWETVIVAGCNEEIIPSKQAIREGNVEEERRLMYVAMTRARDTLILTVRPEAKELNGRVYENPVSRFIGEIA